MCTEAELKFFEKNGFVSVRVLDEKEAEEVAQSVLDDAYRMIFRGEELKGVPEPHSLLFNDLKLRKKYLKDPKCVWKNGNPRKPKLSKSCGMLNRYHNRKVRKILFSPVAHEKLSSLHQVPFGRKVSLVYLNGPDRVGIKAKGAVNMDRHLDQHLFFPSERKRIQAVCCLRVGKEEKKIKRKDLGGIEVLQGFHKVFPLASIYFRGKLGERASSKVVPQVLGKEFDKELPNFLLWLESLFEPEKLAKEDEKVRQIFQDLKLSGVPEIKWVVPEVKPGELFCFLQELPHRNLRNKSNTERIVAYVSLFSRDYLEPGVSLRSYFLGKTGKHSGSNRENEEERECFKDGWDEMVKWTDTETSRKVLAED